MSGVWPTRELRTSDTWRSAGINARRLIDFLLIERMNNAGKENGKLDGPKSNSQGSVLAGVMSRMPYAQLKIRPRGLRARRHASRHCVRADLASSA